MTASIRNAGATLTTTLLLARAHAHMTAMHPQPFVFEQGVAALGVGQPTNRADRSTFIRFQVKLICTAHININTPTLEIEVDLEGTVGQLAGAIYQRARWHWPDLRPASMYIRRSRQGIVDMSDLNRPVFDVLPMAWNDEYLMCRICEVPHTDDQE